MVSLWGDTADKKHQHSFQCDSDNHVLSGIQCKGWVILSSDRIFPKEIHSSSQLCCRFMASTVNTHTNPSSVREESRHSDYYTINAYATFNKVFGQHNVSAVAGFNQEWYKFRKTWGEAEDVITNDLPTLGMTNGAQYTGDNLSIGQFAVHSFVPITTLCRTLPVWIQWTLWRNLSFWQKFSF